MASAVRSSSSARPTAPRRVQSAPNSASSRTTGAGGSVAPELRGVDDLAVALVMRPEREQLDALGACLERARPARRHPDGVHLADLADVLVELDPASAAQDHVDLLRRLVAV